MSGLYIPNLAVQLARNDVGYMEGYNNYNRYSYWQYGQYYNPWCASAVSYWSYFAGFRFGDASCGDKGEYNVGTFENWAQRHGLWRSRDTIAHPGWLVCLTFGIPAQHIELVLSDWGGPVATIGGNTGNGVFYRTRYRGNIEGFIALDEAGQNYQGAPATPTPEVATKMGMTAGTLIPGAGVHTSGPFKGKAPFVSAELQPTGETDLVGHNGANIVGGKAFLGASVFPLGKLNKPIVTVEAQTAESGAYTGWVVGMAEDGGTFAVEVKTS